MNRFYYLLELQYLGFRYHGWQKQPDVKTIQFMLDRTLNTVLKSEQFKSMGASRTDSMVSANHHFSQLALPHQISSEEFIKELNLTLPQDIKALNIKEIDKSFNVLGSKKKKEYHYYFSCGEKSHPFCAPFMTNFLQQLDIELMQKGARLFEGKHNFIQYCFRGNENKVYNRTIIESLIEENRVLTASFFPETTYLFKVKGEGFMRNQIRIMAGTLFSLGQHDITLKQIEDSLKSDNTEKKLLGFIAPASGLTLYKSEFSE